MCIRDSPYGGYGGYGRYPYYGGGYGGYAPSYGNYAYPSTTTTKKAPAKKVEKK